MWATYSVEDNKLRLYSSVRLDDDDYNSLKSAGFKWAPKQAEAQGAACLMVAPMWTPDREDLLLEMCGEIGDEDYSPEERSADRAERFSGYRDRRAGEAGAAADAFDAGPSAFGHQNRARAERQAARHDRKRLYACSQWSKAEYWQDRTKAVIAHALFKSSAKVRRGRILELEKEKRATDKSLAEYSTRYDTWSRVARLPGADQVITRSPTGYGIDRGATPLAGVLAYAMASDGRYDGDDFTHPRTGEANRSAYDLLTDPKDPCTPAEVAALWLAAAIDPASPDSWSARWSAHYAMRLEYHNALLAEEGGSAGSVEMEPGGWIRPDRRSVQFGRAHVNAEGWCQILRIFKSPATGRVTSVQVYGADPFLNDREVKPRKLNVERLGEDCYRPPTDDERAAFATQQAEAKATAKATKPKSPPLINPTDEDAEKLQAIWNDRGREGWERSKSYGDFPAQTVRRMTQAEYSAASKGTYSHLRTETISERLIPDDSKGRCEVFKLRIAPSQTSSFSRHVPNRVIVLTDKPQTAIPWDRVDTAQREQPTAESLFPLMGQIYVLATTCDCIRDDDRAQLLDDARYCGLVSVSSSTQRSLTDAGWTAYKQWNETRTASCEAANR